MKREVQVFRNYDPIEYQIQTMIERKLPGLQSPKLTIEGGRLQQMRGARLRSVSRGSRQWPSTTVEDLELRAHEMIPHSGHKHRRGRPARQLPQPGSRPSLMPKEANLKPGGAR